MIGRIYGGNAVVRLLFRTVVGVAAYHALFIQYPTPNFQFFCEFCVFFRSHKFPIETYQHFILIISISFTNTVYFW